jgi:hypothetical protein
LIGTLLFFGSTLALAWTCFPRLGPASRVAAASLCALCAPILALALAARLGLEAPLPLLVGAHAALWLAAARGLRRRPPPDSRGAVLDAVVLSAAVALASALLGRDPSQDRLVDPWAHLAWSRDLGAALHAYVPGFPALIAALAFPDPLLGAFRLSAVVLHFAFAAQVVAVGSRGAPGALPALAALAYLLTPASGKFEPPRPEMLGAVLVGAGWWALLEPGIEGRRRGAALGLLAFVTALCHVSALEVVHLGALGLAVALGAGGGSPAGRAATLAAMAAGAASAVAVSPWLGQLLVSPGRVALLAATPGLLRPLPIRSIVGGLGLPLVGLTLVAVVRGARERSALGPAVPRALACLILAAAGLLAVLVSAAFGVRPPGPVFTDRPLIAAALMLALAAALALGRPPGSRGWTTLALAAFALGVGARPLAPWPRVALGACLGAAVGAARARAGPAARAAVAVALLALAIAARPWIWTPRVPAAAEWLRQAPDRLPVVTHWPVTNELDALLDAPVLDGLAGRDANRALHRLAPESGLADRLEWCGGGGDVARLRTALRDRGFAGAFVVVDDRFTEAWSSYRGQHEAALASGHPERYPMVRPSPCALPPPERLAAMRAALRAGPDGVPVFEAPGVTIFRLRLR